MAGNKQNDERSGGRVFLRLVVECKVVIMEYYAYRQKFSKMILGCGFVAVILIDG